MCCILETATEKTLELPPMVVRGRRDAGDPAKYIASIQRTATRLNWNGDTFIKSGGEIDVRIIQVVPPLVPPPPEPPPLTWDDCEVTCLDRIINGQVVIQITWTRSDGQKFTVNAVLFGGMMYMNNGENWFSRLNNGSPPWPDYDWSPSGPPPAASHMAYPPSGGGGGGHDQE